jgi:tetratricopeptide (TPR) repeat protein
LQALLAFFAIALIGSATLYVLKPEMLKPSNLLAATKQQLRSWMAKPSASRPAEQKTDPAPSTGAKVSIGEQRVPGPQEYVDVAIQHINRRDFTRAFTALEQAEAMGARGSDFFAARAYANWASGNQEQAIADYGEAIRIDPGNATNYTNRAVAYNSRGEHMLAIRDLERAIAIEPNNPDNWNSRCWSRGLVGQLQEAILDCNESLRLRPNDPNTLDSRGFAHLRAGENTRAIADFDAALAANNQIPSSLYGRGLAKMRTGDRSGGLKDIAEAKSMNPGIEELFTKIGIR